MKKIEKPYKMGDLILITHRKCSDKVQPRIEVGKYYLVMKEGRLKNGALTLSVAEFSKMAQEGLKNPKGYINPKDIMQCNEERFEWKRKTQKELMAKFQQFKQDFYKKQEEQDEAFLKEKFTEKERIQMAYHPYIYAELAWYYAMRALDIAKARKIDSLKKISRKLEEYRNNFLFELCRKMSQPILDCAQKKVLQMLEDNSTDFFIFYTTVKNALNYQYVGLPDDDIKAYAYMSILCHESQLKLDDANIEIIRKKLGFASKHESFKYMSDLKKCMQDYLAGLEVKKTNTISTAVAVMEKNVMNIKL